MVTLMIDWSHKDNSNKVAKTPMYTALIARKANLGKTVFGTEKYNNLRDDIKLFPVYKFCTNGHISDRLLLTETLGIDINPAEYMRLNTCILHCARQHQEDCAGWCQQPEAGCIPFEG